MDYFLIVVGESLRKAGKIKAGNYVVNGDEIPVIHLLGLVQAINRI